MPNKRTIDWSGDSGKKYRYQIYEIGVTFGPSPGNYVFARESKPRQFKPIYVGETGDLSERFDYHHKMACIREHGTTHICVHASSSNSDERKAEEDDIIAKWTPECNA